MIFMVSLSRLHRSLSRLISYHKSKFIRIRGLYSPCATIYCYLNISRLRNYDSTYLLVEFAQLRVYSRSRVIITQSSQFQKHYLLLDDLYTFWTFVHEVSSSLGPYLPSIRPSSAYQDFHLTNICLGLLCLASDLLGLEELPSICLAICFACLSHHIRLP